jgi:5-methylcytosine-specific restriction endonuclease McrA
MRKTLPERLKSTLKSMKARARKEGAVITFTAEELESVIPERCRWCQKRITPATLNVDHKVPVSRGGSWSLDNLEGICAPCNRKKSILDSNEYHRLLQKLSELTDELGSDFVARNVLKRLAAGSAWIYS